MAISQTLISFKLRKLMDENPSLLKTFIFFLLGLLFKCIVGWTLSLTLLTLFVIYTLTGGWRYLRIVVYTIKRDLRGLCFLVYMTFWLRRYKKNGDNVVTVFQNTAKKYPNKNALIMIDERSWTFREIDEYSNAVANYFYEQGYRKNDVVAIFMENRPEFVILWLGLAKVGVVSALINYNLRLKAFSHCISTSGARSLIYSTELSDVVSESLHLLPPGMTFYCRGSPKAEFQSLNLDSILDNYPTSPPSKTTANLMSDKLLYIFTSGTTGLPKAAVIIHSRYFYMASSIYFFYRMRSDDVVYDTLPLYHTAGGILGIGNCLINGCTIVMRKKFSASRFWSDCKTYNCTVAQYIGEICRYLLVQSPSHNDTSHSVRLMFGNGLRPHIWDEFKTRFNIKLLGEFYGATEGNANIANIDNTRGAIGFQSRILPFVYPVTLIKVDLITGEPIRNKYGRCTRCEPGEPGELVGKIVSGKPLREFDGYANKEANMKKIARDVFKLGDCYFLTSDILEMDEFGYMYFRDRTGDTYRWKGENVSTSEVEGVISNTAHLTDAVVYGVEIPGTEGRAGMVAIADPQRTLDLKYLNRELQKALPSYARPVFVRVLCEVDLTGTFKMKKVEYRNDGFNPSIVKDSLYYLNNKSNEYQILDKEICADILSGNIKF